MAEYKVPKPKPMKVVETLLHGEDKRKNIPTAEYQSVVDKDDQASVRLAYERRNRDLDPQLVWRGKDEQDWSDLIVHAPPIYIQEKVHPKVLIDELLRASKSGSVEQDPEQPDLFGDFNGIPEGADKTDFYQHDANWSNRMILGDSLQVMASLAERESLRGKVQCIYIDPPYGIKFNSNFQWSTTSRDVKDGKADHITREPEMVKAFRDTWRDGIHSYLTYLRDRLTVSRDLLTDSGSVFLQIGDENVHRARAVLDEIFGEENFVSQISFVKTTSATSDYLPGSVDYILWFARHLKTLKYRKILQEAKGNRQGYSWLRWPDGRFRGMTIEEKLGVADTQGDALRYQPDNITSQSGGESTRYDVQLNGNRYKYYSGGWKTNELGMTRLARAGRLHEAKNSLRYVRYEDDFPVKTFSSNWTDTATGNFTEDKIYVVQTAQKVIERCIIMATDPGDLVLDPTCGSGTTATVAEQWGRRWITIDTSRVALALARARVMGARFPFYVLADTLEGQLKEAEVSNSAPSTKPVFGALRQGFVYERVPHIQLGDIARNAEVDVIWDKWHMTLEPLRQSLNTLLQTDWAEWQIPRGADPKWTDNAKTLHAEWWEARIARQKEIDKSIAAKAEFEFLYDKPYEDKKKVRVAGPFTVESLSPHRVVGLSEDDDLIDGRVVAPDESHERDGFVEMILENLRAAGVQQAHKEDRIAFTALAPWPGRYICAEGRYFEGETEKRAGLLLGPEFGSLTRQDLVEAAREAGDADFDVLIACAFNFDAHSSEFDKLGRVPVLKARMNADLYMAADLKSTGKGNLFVIFGEPDIDVMENDGLFQVQINGVDVFDPKTGEVRSDDADGIACWFIDTDYNGESFFTRHAYFLGANDPYKALKTTLKAEINEEAWATLYSDTSRPFEKPESGRIAVKVINHLGDEVMKVFRV